MSLVGTRPILQDELLKYELHHRARNELLMLWDQETWFLCYAVHPVELL